MTKVLPTAQLTAEAYPKVKRNPDFKILDADDLKFFQTFLDNDELIHSSIAEETASFNQDWMKKYRGQSNLILLPKSTEKVSQILKYCNENKLAVVPQGGNTDLVGASVPVFDEIILSLRNMNKIRDFNHVSGTFKCDAGVVMRDAHKFLHDHDHIFPLDLPSRNNCQVGGVVSTNAGGLNLLRYGSLHGNVLGLEVVLPNGEVISNINALRKDNTGYDLKQLFIGAEGTIGVITGVSILAAAKPKALNAIFIGIDSFDTVQNLFLKAKNELSEILSAFEFMDRGSIECTIEYLKDMPFPLKNQHNFYVLIETSGSMKKHDDEKLEAFLSSALETKLISEGNLAKNEEEYNALWTWRKSVPPACNSYGGMYKYDMSLELKDLYSVSEAVTKRLNAAGLIGDAPKPVVKSVGYGHVGDGNIHLNIAVREFTKEIENLLEPFVYEYIASKRGSISAEHGVGFHKKGHLHYSRSDIEIRFMKDIRKHYDPNGILNPYKYV
ncbi:hypothetical protein NCAS_0H00160 [Naumovozyma castellii]|uniref:D-lactate ferricytochrome C oxidoreductase n=1 Tax=Naumovozyma castellii TaxID=27288 RepID=G0VIK1_NAUCA|nr:hypothetical protein NCAS_0H00160 [Naumovozyma castellii CBS 4309]CCC71326.1 hypothetical protein NCAS_0H00160 [Naumovozyma castellii CBS 4309]